LTVLELDVDGAVGTHGHGCTEDIGRFGGAGGDGANVLDTTRSALLVANADRLLDRELIERVHRVLDTGRLDARLGLVDSGLDLKRNVSLGQIMPPCKGAIRKCMELTA
jgi:hypothetical protein